MFYYFGLIFGLLCPISMYSVVFQGLVEDSSITMNTFTCPSSATGSQDCENTSTGAIGFHLTGSQLLQFFNNQSYWLKQETQREQVVQTDLRYSGAALQNKMKSEGWVAMGGYCILISANPFLTNLIMPTVKASGDNVKVVVQLWYSGDSLLQLWSQDAAVLTKDQGFKISVTSAIDAEVAKLPVVASGGSFAGQIGLQPNNRQSVYALANNSPRTVKIQAMS